jgi:hypothetical protein
MARKRRLLLAFCLSTWTGMFLACGGGPAVRLAKEIERAAKESKEKEELEAIARVQAAAEAKEDEASRKAYVTNVEHLKAEHQEKLEQYQVAKKAYDEANHSYQKAKAEHEAVTKLEEGRKLLEGSMSPGSSPVFKKYAEQRLQAVIKNFPETQSAKDAKALLDGKFVPPRKIPVLPVEPREPVAPGPLVLPPPPRVVVGANPPKGVVKPARPKGFYLPGLVAADVYGDFTKQDFILTKLGNSDQQIWNCVKENSNSRMTVEVFGEASNRLTRIQATYFNKSSVANTNLVARHFLASAVSVPYDGSDTERAKQWVTSNIGKNATTKIGRVTFELIANGPNVRVLVIEPGGR